MSPADKRREREGRIVGGERRWKDRKTSAREKKKKKRGGRMKNKLVVRRGRTCWKVLSWPAPVSV